MTTVNSNTIEDSTPATVGMLASLMQTLGRALGKTLNTRTAALEHRIAELEARLPLEYAGVWRPEQGASKGCFYTDHGSIWFCKSATFTRPSEDPTSWVLACKRGADAR